MPCTDIGQGSNPLRIISMRALPDQPGDKEYPREEWVGLDEKEIAARREQLDKDKAAGKDVDLDQSGDYVVRTQTLAALLYAYFVGRTMRSPSRTRRCLAKARSSSRRTFSASLSYFIWLARL